MKMFQNPFRFEGHPVINRQNPVVNGQNAVDIFDGIDGNDVMCNVDASSITFESKSNSSDSIVFERLDSYDDSISSNSISPNTTGEVIESSEITLFGPKPANNLMMLSLLEHLCTLYVDNEETGKRLFEVLCRKLCGMKLIQNFGTLDNAKAIRQKYQAAFVDMMNSALETLDPSSLNPEKIWHLANKRNVTSLTLHSWYKDMFHEEKLIAHGGFGEVCQAKNKLDQKFYAIKKVKLIESKPDVCQKTLREVQVFSNLNHPNVVRYHSSWLEYGITEFTGSKMDEHDGLATGNQFTPPAGPSELVPVDIDLLGSRFGNFNVGLLKNAKPQRYISYEKRSESLSNGSCDENLEQDEDEDASSICSVSPANDEKPCRKRIPSLGRSFSSGDVPLHRNQMEEISYCRGKFYDANLRKALNMTLFIQMELCQLTLKQWINDRNNKVDESSCCICRYSNLKIFKQIILAIQYIHREGLIHRDIKPANIFLNITEGNNIALKIGDFGLARDDILPKTPTGVLYQTDISIDCYALQPNLDHTKGVGTAVYAAPEQKSTRYYSNKVDIFSAGIILYELYRQFKTDMERLKSIEDLINIQNCGNIKDKWKEESELILEMTLTDPDKRPAADIVLGSPLLTINLDSDNIDQLKSRLSQQELEIKHLKRLLREAESKICLQCQSKCNHNKPDVA